MNRMLYDVRQDAFRKLIAVKKAERNQIIDAVIRIMKLSEITWENGLLALADAKETEGSGAGQNYLRRLIQVLVDGCEAEELLEIMTNEYWVQNPEAGLAMEYYIYLRGGIMLQSCRYEPYKMQQFLESILPLSWREDYKRRLKEKRDAEKRYVLKSFEKLKVTVESAEVKEKINTLETEILKMSSQDLTEWIRRQENRELTVCFMVFGKQVQRKIESQLGGRMAFTLREDAVYRKKHGMLDEAAIEKAVERGLCYA